MELSVSSPKFNITWLFIYNHKNGKELKEKNNNNLKYLNKIISRYRKKLLLICDIIVFNRSQDNRIML